MDSTKDDGDELDLSDPLVGRAIADISVEALGKARKAKLQAPQATSGQSKPQHPRLMQVRKWAAVASVLVIVYNIAKLFGFSVPAALAFALMGCVLSILLACTLLGEVLWSAGWDVQTQWKTSDGWKRTYRFAPSISSPLYMLGLLFIVFGGMVVGFASVFLQISLEKINSFNQQLDGLNALYLSIVTFATVGFGDLYAVSTTARVCVMAEIVFSFFIVTFTFATALSWLLDRRQKIAEDRARAKAEDTQRREELIEAAGLGVYDQEGVFEEKVKRRVEELRRETGQTK